MGSEPQGLRVLVCGGRDFSDRVFLWRSLDRVLYARGVSVVIHGAAPGADRLAGEWARFHHIPEERYPAEWEKLGKRAGPVRNAAMLMEGKPDAVIVFPGGRGTADMVRRARSAGIRVWEPQRARASQPTGAHPEPASVPPEPR